MSVKISSFERDGVQFPVIELKSDESQKYGFTFGMSKAKLILAHVEEIRTFVEQYKKKEA